MGTLSIVQVAYALKIMGFGKNSFLEFGGFEPTTAGLKKFLQVSQEEGKYMGTLSKDILNMLEWPLSQLKEKVDEEQLHSRLKFKVFPIDDLKFAERAPMVNIYITGDNTSQPDRDLLSRLTEAQLARTSHLEAFIRRFNSVGFDHVKEEVALDSATRLLIVIERVLVRLEQWISYLLQRSKVRMVAKTIKRSVPND